MLFFSLYCKNSDLYISVYNCNFVPNDSVIFCSGLRKYRTCIKPVKQECKEGVEQLYEQNGTLRIYLLKMDYICREEKEGKFAIGSSFITYPDKCRGYTGFRSMHHHCRKFLVYMITRKGIQHFLFKLSTYVKDGQRKIPILK